MIWSKNLSYELEPFELESDLELSISESSKPLFGDSRIYLDMKRLIGQKGSTQNIPDGYLIDLTSSRDPKLYLVEVELGIHEPLKHIAVQILEFSLSYETSPQLVKSILKEGLIKNSVGFDKCNEYAIKNGFENIDYLLERIIYKKDSFIALVIIDEIDEELETVLLSRFKFPVEVLTFQRFISPTGERLYSFEPFLQDVGTSIEAFSDGQAVSIKTIDPAEIDTIVVPAQEEGFKKVFLGQNCWYAIRIHSSMMPRLKYIAAYQVAPISAITYIAPIKSIQQYEDTNKYFVYFFEPAKKINPIKLIPKSIVKSLRSSRYTSYDRLMKAKDLNEAF